MIINMKLIKKRIFLFMINLKSIFKKVIPSADLSGKERKKNVPYLIWVKE